MDKIKIEFQGKDNLIAMIKENLKRGTIELILLAMLKDSDKYGYQIVHSLFSRSHGHYILQEGSMYPSLYRLLEKGFIEDRKELVGKKRTRVYYHLTPAGRTQLDRLISEYRAITEGIEAVIEVEPVAEESDEEIAE